MFRKYRAYSSAQRRSDGSTVPVCTESLQLCLRPPNAFAAMPYCLRNCTARHCSSPVVFGSCHDPTTVDTHYFDESKSECRELALLDRGCLRSSNRFTDIRTCHGRCAGEAPRRIPNECLESARYGHCTSKDVSVHYFYYDVTTRSCKAWEFTDGKCLAGSAVRFAALDVCESHCKVQKPPAECKTRPDVVDCPDDQKHYRAFSNRFYADGVVKHECKSVPYSCVVSKNRFSSAEECGQECVNITA